MDEQKIDTKRRVLILQILLQFVNLFAEIFRSVCRKRLAGCKKRFVICQKTTYIQDLQFAIALFTGSLHSQALTQPSAQREFTSDHTLGKEGSQLLRNQIDCNSSPIPPALVTAAAKAGPASRESGD